ncbi:MAG: hypothetical protein FJX74_10645 [Armatimonadetes bacterium]|nr:hypothetical protein [Armatimonadota bacterium]
MSNRVAENEAFLRNLYRKGPFQGHAFCVNAISVPLLELGDYTVREGPIERWVPWVVENYERQVRMLEAVGDDSVPVARLGTGTQLYAAAFGCPVHEYEDTNPCALPMVRTAQEADALVEPTIEGSRQLSRVIELGHLVQEALGPDASLGPCDVQSGFDTASLIWNKEQFILAMIDEPEAVHRLVGKCAHLLKAFLMRLREEFPRLSPCHCPAAWSPPELGPWLSNDECGAFGNAHFKQFMLPELIDLAETFGGLGMHCCADAEHQFPLFRRIPNLYGFNRVAGKQGWDTLLEHFDGPGAPVHVLGFMGEDQMMRLIDRATEGTRFVFVHDTGDAEEGRRWYARMRQVSPRTD